MNIKQEKEDSAFSLTGEGQEQFSNLTTGLLQPDETTRTSSSCLTPPTQRVLPTTAALSSYLGIGLSLGLQSPLQLSPPGLESLSESRLLYQVKRFLSTLIKFGADISVPVGEKVKKIVFDLVVDKISISQFQRQLQDVTTFPVRPFVLPFLHTNIPILRDRVVKMASTLGVSPLDYLTKHESVVLNQEELTSSSQESDIFHSVSELAMEPTLLAGKRKSVSHSENGSSSPKRPNNQPSLLTPPLFPTVSNSGRRQLVYPHHWNPNGAKLGSAPGLSQVNSSTSQEREERSNEEEWKNVQVMLNCILGMVEKTQRAITILQQRQTTAANLRTTEEIVAAVQDKANSAIMEVKQAAMEQIRKATSDNLEGEEEVCLNCGRPATETCSGCNLARYCGAFCQHRDWETGGHHGICGGKGDQAKEKGSAGGKEKEEQKKSSNRKSKETIIVNETSGNK